MSNIPPIEDGYIDDVIKSSGPLKPNLNKTQGIELRALVKLLRDRLENEIFDHYTVNQVALSLKVDQIIGKQLSTEDFSTSEKQKLASLKDLTGDYIKVSSPSPQVANINLDGDISAKYAIRSEQHLIASLPNSTKFAAIGTENSTVGFGVGLSDDINNILTSYGSEGIAYRNAGSLWTTYIKPTQEALTEASITIYAPGKSGILALLSDINDGFLPLTGGTLTGSLTVNGSLFYKSLDLNNTFFSKANDDGSFIVYNDATGAGWAANTAGLYNPNNNRKYVQEKTDAEFNSLNVTGNANIGSGGSLTTINSFGLEEHKPLYLSTENHYLSTATNISFANGDLAVNREGLGFKTVLLQGDALPMTGGAISGNLVVNGECDLNGNIISTVNGNIFRYVHGSDGMIFGGYIGGDNFSAYSITNEVSGKHFKSFLAPTEPDDVLRLSDVQASYLSLVGGNLSGDLAIGSPYKFYGSIQGANGNFESLNLSGTYRLSNNDNRFVWDNFTEFNGDYKTKNIGNNRGIGLHYDTGVLYDIYDNKYYLKQGDALPLIGGEVIGNISAPTFNNVIIDFNKGGTFNTRLGIDLFGENIIGSSNVAIGQAALKLLNNGSSNLGIGDYAGAGLTTGSSNVAIGANALRGSTETNSAVAIGKDALSGSGNYSNSVAIGHGAGVNSNGGANVYLGSDAGAGNTGSGNIFIGFHAGFFYANPMSNKFIISNGQFENEGVLIKGDFATKYVEVERLNVSDSLNLTNGDIEIDDFTKGVVLKSPNGVRWRIAISDTGILTTITL